MAEQIVSPGVFQRETDQSFITPSPVEVGAAIVGPTVRGPIEQPTVVSSFADYKNKFGTTFVSASENLEFLTSIAVQKFFSNGANSMLVTRVGSGSFTTATSTNITAAQGAGLTVAKGSLTIATNFTPEDEIQISVGGTEYRFIAADPVGGVPANNSPMFYFSTGSSIAITIDKMVAAIDAAGIGVDANDGCNIS